MGRNPFKIPGLSKFPTMPGIASKIPSDAALNPKPSMVGPEQPGTPEARRERFKRLAGVLGGLKKK